jgi:hypothetical protein
MLKRHNYDMELIQVGETIRTDFAFIPKINSHFFFRQIKIYKKQEEIS